MISAFGIEHGVSKSYTAAQPFGADGVRGPVYDKAKADQWRGSGLKVTERTDKNGKTRYARSGRYPNVTERRGLLRRKRTRTDFTRVEYERSTP